jgi:transcriptional regulator with XRE-family HTH domain
MVMPPLVTPPSFGTYLRHVRQTAEPSIFPITRARSERPTFGPTKLAAESGISEGYLLALEQGKKLPSVKVVENLADALGLHDSERQHLKDLAGFQTPVTSEQDTLTVSDTQREFVDRLHPALAGWVDEAWNLLYGNVEYLRIFRGLEHCGNVLTWFFAEPQSRAVMVEWEIEARLTVGWLRGHMARRPGSTVFDGLLDKLAGFPKFVTMWSRQEVILGRHTPLMRLRDLDQGRELTLNAEVFRFPDPRNAVQLYLAGAEPVSPAKPGTL